MIVLNLELKGIYGFDDFHINFSYPKKIVNSIIEHEHLKGRERFRYKKAVILWEQTQLEKPVLGKHYSVYLDIYLTEIHPRFLIWLRITTDISV